MERMKFEGRTLHNGGTTRFWLRYKVTKREPPRPLFTLPHGIPRPLSPTLVDGSEE